ncbi:tyrosine-type recombinase/integrase [Mesorhizobium sp. ASY16-5R]|uniref:tyrosine-type recombinase/integrase n=1 Tax=Mesorhizobium sp. ASY16-5R TaxID=3445772 RepID=UPI003FA121A1
MHALVHTAYSRRRLPSLTRLRSLPKHDVITLCANSYGKPWTLTGFRTSWRPIRTRLEKSGRGAPRAALKGLRRTVATILAERGRDERTIADMLGPKTIEMARHYAKRPNRPKKMTGVVTDFNEVNRRRTKTAKPV